MALDGNGNIYVTGYVPGGQFTPSKRDIYLAKVTSEGAGVWLQPLEMPSHDIGEDVVVDQAGNVYVVGLTHRNRGFGAEDVLLTRFDGDGNWVGEYQIGSIGHDTPHAIAVDSVGNVYVAGMTNTTLGDQSYGNNDGVLIKFGNNPLPIVHQIELPEDDVNSSDQSGHRLKGTRHADRLKGGSNDDTLIGGNGNDRLLGLDGDDVIEGGKGNDRLKGGSGHDILIGDAGSDVLMGNSGMDVFALQTSQHDVDLIKHFKNGEDRLVLPHRISFGAIDVMPDRSRTLLSLGDDVLAVLTGVRATQIDVNDFTGS